MEMFLLSATANPTDVIVGSARTCYSPSGLIMPEDVTFWPKKQSLFEDLFKSGHHTTLQHTYITIGIKNVSRHFIWRFLHQHQYYNSEQVSQRYTKVKPEHFYYPESKKEDYIEMYNKSYSTYLLLIDKLMPIMSDLLPKFKQDQAKKKAQEMARYVLPVSVTADLYHTINIATALRYIAAAKNAKECIDETKEFVEKLKIILLNLDPSFSELINLAEKESITNDFEFYNIEEGISIISQKTGFKKNDLVCVYDINTSNIEAFGHKFNSSSYADILSSNQVQSGPEHLDGFASIMNISLSADAQNQRHRRSIGFRPTISCNDLCEKRFYTPPIFFQHEDILKIYNDYMNELYTYILEKTRVEDMSDYIYLLPNAHMITIIEKNDFASFFHKSKMRLCWNAQQEIYDITLHQIELLRDKGVNFIDLFGAPCHVRSRLKIAPTCPEGSRFCGTKVWKEKIGEISRKI